MRAMLLTVGVVCVACGTPALPDAGTGLDAGAPPDAGPTCEGIPAGLFATCVALGDLSTSGCAGSASDVIDAGQHVCGGGTSRMTCAGFDVAAWISEPLFGDSYQCFFAADGGSLRGVIHYLDHGVQAAGSVADCALSITRVPCDGGP